MTFGEHLYNLRNNKKISQEELAELLDASLAYLMRDVNILEFYAHE